MPNNPNAAANLKPFKKGDKRINRYGRPKSFDLLRKLAVRIAGEEVADGATITRIELMLRAMASSRNPADRKTFLEYAYGKVKDELENSGNVVLEVVYKDAKNDNSDT